MHRADEDIDVRPAVELRTQLGVDRVTLDVQDIGACPLSDRLDRGATEPESDPRGIAVSVSLTRPGSLVEAVFATD